MADTVKEWSVAIEFEADPAPKPDEVLQLLEELEPYRPGGASFNGNRIGVHLWVQVVGFGAAGSAVASELVEAATRAGIRKVEIVSASLKRWSDFEKELEESNAPQLAGVAELAEILGVSKQRVSELADTPAFPQPLARLRSGPVWDRRSIGNFLQTWKRAPGRPSASSQIVVSKTSGGYQASLKSPTGEVLGRTDVFSNKMQAVHAMEVAKQLLTEKPVDQS